jgi:hypothetical protein
LIDKEALDGQNNSIRHLSTSGGFSIHQSILGIVKRLTQKNVMEKLHEKSHSDHLGDYFCSDGTIDFSKPIFFYDQSVVAGQPRSP